MSEIALQIAERVADAELRHARALGYDAMGAYLSSWAALDGVVLIDGRDHPTIYQTTEAKMIQGRAS